MSGDDPIADFAPTDTALELEGRQRALHRALTDVDIRLAEYYEGALVAFAHTRNPDRLSHVCHGIRELMEKLPRFMDVPIEASNVTLMSKVANLHQDWGRMRKNTQTVSVETWEGTLDGAMKRFLRRVETFFEWWLTSRPSRIAAAERVVRNLDPLELPIPILQFGAQEYMAMREYFEGVAHHSDATEEDVAKWLAVLERFLLERLVPRTDEDFDAIDKLVGGDTSANT